MRFGIRKPSLRGRISARTSWKRAVRHRMGFKAPRGYGFLTNPKKALYNRVYNRTTVSVDDLLKSKKTGPGVEFGGGSDISEIIVNWTFASAVIIGFLMWLGCSLKWALILTAGGLITAIVGAEGFKVILVLFFVGWFALHWVGVL